MAEEAMVYDLAVIGGGPAGYTAALYAARAGLSAVVLEKTAPGGQMAATGIIDNYPGFDEGVEGFLLAQKMQAGAERFGAKTLYAGAAAVELAQNPKRITLDTPANAGSAGLLARTVVLATGASPRRLGLPEEAALAGRGVSYCAVCDGMFYRGKTVVVVGGGNTAADDAEYLARLCKKVFLVHRRSALRAAPARQKALETAGVEFVWNSRVAEILHEAAVTGVRLIGTDGNAERVLPCDGVFVAIGRVPDTALFAGQLPMDEAGCLLADETTRTPLPGVFAAGDVRQKPLRQIVTAAADGAAAAYFAGEYLRAQH